MRTKIKTTGFPPAASTGSTDLPERSSATALDGLSQSVPDLSAGHRACSNCHATKCSRSQSRKLPQHFILRITCYRIEYLRLDPTWSTRQRRQSTAANPRQRLGGSTLDRATNVFACFALKPCNDTFRLTFCGLSDIFSTTSTAWFL